MHEKQLQLWYIFVWRKSLEFLFHPGEWWLCCWRLGGLNTPICLDLFKENMRRCNKKDKESRTSKTLSFTCRHREMRCWLSGIYWRETHGRTDSIEFVTCLVCGLGLLWVMIRGFCLTALTYGNSEAWGGTMSLIGPIDRLTIKAHWYTDTLATQHFFMI